LSLSQSVAYLAEKFLSIITLVNKFQLFVCILDKTMCSRLIWVCWFQKWKPFCSITYSFL